jgi:hypothetical protein
MKPEAATRWQELAHKADITIALTNVRFEGYTITTTATAHTPSVPILSTFNTNFSRANINVVRVGLNYQFH